MKHLKIIALILLFIFISSCSIALVVSAMSSIAKNEPTKSNTSYLKTNN